MKFSTKTTYGLRAIICLAKNGGSEVLPLSFVAQKEHMPLKYLEKIFSDLKKSGLIESAKGPTGGYRLVSRPEEINFFDIIKALEGKLNLFHCIDDNDKVFCRESCSCGATKSLVKVQANIIGALKNIKLSSLL